MKENNVNEYNINEKSSTMRSELKEGCIASFYTLKGYFLKVYEAYAIDKVKFSFVEKGTSGSGFDVYMDINEFEDLCEEILDNTLNKRIQQDNQSDFPNAFKYVTGENGSKEILLGMGKKNITWQGKDKSKNKQAFVPVISYRELKFMARWFKRTSQKYYNDMVNLFIDASIEKSNKFGNHENTEKPQNNKPVNASNEQANGKKLNESVPKDGSKPVASKPKESNTNSDTDILVSTSSLLTPFGSKGLYCIKGITKNNKEYTFIIDPKTIAACQDWTSFKAQSGAATKIMVTFTYAIIKERYLVNKLVLAA